MADEILGNCYELITEIALEDYSSVIKKGEQIFAQETPLGIGIVPDIIIGTDIHKPRILLQVHHTRAERASEKKFWRNVGEYVDARNALGGATQIVTIAFDSGQKRKLSAAATHLMDGFLEVDRQFYGKELLAFAKALETEIEAGKIKGDKRLELARGRLAKRPATVVAIKAFANDLNATLSSASKAGASWFATYSMIQAGRSASRIPKRKLTTLRRALGRFLPVDDEVLLRKLLHSIRTGGKATWPQYLIDLGIATKTLAGGTFTNPCPLGTRVSRKMESDPAYEAFLMAEHFNNDEIVRLWKKLRSITTSMTQACASIRSADEFVLYHKFVVDNFAMLTTQAGMAKALEDCFDDPDTVLGKTIGLAIPAEKGVWLFDYVMTIIKAQTGKQQGYGYTKLSEEAGIKVDDKRSILDFALPKMLNRTEFPSVEVTKKFSGTLADRLASVTKRWVNLNQAEIARFVLKGQFEDKIYKTASFDPALDLVLLALKGSGGARDKRSATFLTGYIGKGAGTCDTLTIGDTLIMWQSASAQGDDHKTKELCGRIGMLRVTTSKAEKVIPTPIKKAILVIDGTWREDQLDRLAVAGFDAIYYVDEVDQLAKDIT